METNDRLARAIRGLTIAIWCWIGLQALIYGYSSWNFWRVSNPTGEVTTTPRQPSDSAPLGGESDYDNDFVARPMRDKVRLATVILLVEMKEIDGVHRAIVQEILKQQPGVRLYYKVGDEYDELNHFPGEGCDGCTPMHRSLVFMQGNPAMMRFSTTFQGDRLAGLGGITLDDLRKFARDSSKSDPQ